MPPKKAAPKKAAPKKAKAAEIAAAEAEAKPVTPVEAEEPVKPAPKKKAKAETAETTTSPKKPTPKRATPKSAAKASQDASQSLLDGSTDDLDERSASRRVSRRVSAGPTVTEEMAYEGTTEFKRVTADSDFDAKSMLRIISWNVAGLRGFLNKGGDLAKFCKDEQPDILCLQETKLSDPADCPKLAPIDGYSFVDSISTSKKGYSGTRTYVKNSLGEGATHAFGFDLSEPDSHDEEGRVVTTTLPAAGGLAIVNTYVPNSGMTLERLDYRCESFDPMVRSFLNVLPARDKIVWTGDLNVAERDYDRFWGGNFKQMQKSPGFTPEERASFRKTLSECNMVDAFRLKYPTAARAGTYTFFSARFNQRAKGNGWRLDYFVVSAALAARVVDCFPLGKYDKSDHQPLVLWLRR